MLTIRPETAADYAAVEKVVRQAFGRNTEADLVRRLRATPGYIPELALLAELDGRAAGQALFSRIRIETPAAVLPALTLAPLAVLPALQRRGIGSALMTAGLARCRELGHRVVVLFGHPEYYPRFGFERASLHGLRAPFDAPDEAFMVCGLDAGALQDIAGMVVLPDVFVPEPPPAR